MSEETSIMVGSRVPRDRDGAAAIRATGGVGHAGVGHAGRVTLPEESHCRGWIEKYA